MFRLNNKFAYHIILLISMFLVACSGSNSSSSTQQGSLSFNINGNLQITRNSNRFVYLQLNNSKNLKTQKIAIIVDDPAIAKVSPRFCYVSSTAPNCAIVVYGLKNGTTSLSAVSAATPANNKNLKNTSYAYDKISIPSTVGDAPVYGALGVESSIFIDPLSMESSANVNVSFSTYESVSGYYTINVTGGLKDSSGIPGNNYAIFNVQSYAPVVISAGGGAGSLSCSVSSLQPTCTLTFYVPASAIVAKTPLTLQATVAGAIVAALPTGFYPPIAITAIGTTKAYPGQVQISTQTSNPDDINTATIPVGMNAPLFINWNNVAMNGAVNVTLTSSNPGNVSFYSYTPGNNESPVLSATASCVLTYPTALSCGQGISALNTGSATITATAVANNKQSYTVNNLNLTVVAQESAIRKITFSNNSTESIAIGITSGGAHSYINFNTPSVIPSAPGANLAAGGGSQCGLTNPLAACPIGSTCLQGGATPTANSTYYCFYDQQPPVCNGTESCSNGYVLQPGGSTVFSISGSSGDGDPLGIIWSGNFFARTKCDPITGICENASCNDEAGGLMCGPGVGGSPGINTLAETTFQRDGDTDFYDVSIINGLNFAVAFGPTDISADSKNAYLCGTAGGAQQGSWPSTTGLPASLWESTPSSTSFPSIYNITNESASSYYRIVSESTGTICSADSMCTSPQVCGYPITGASAINESTTLYPKHCGKPIAWITADGIYGLNQTGINLSSLPFNFTESWTNPVSSSPQFYVGDLQLCINNAFSSFAAQPAGAYGNTLLACGGTSWTGITRLAQAVITQGPQWESNVLPTITWLKQACPTCYTFPFDDMSSTFTCTGSKKYSIIFSNPPQ